MSISLTRREAMSCPICGEHGIPCGCGDDDVDIDPEDEVDYQAGVAQQ
jgi:hypothetical protein